jgi:hypothetical protein
MSLEEMTLVFFAATGIVVVMSLVSYQISHLQRLSQSWPSIPARVVELRLIGEWSPEYQVKVAYVQAGAKHEVWAKNPNAVETSRLGVGGLVGIKFNPASPRACVLG